MEFSFKLWLEVDAVYYNDKFKHRTDRAAAQRIDPFAKFFPQGQSRLYFKPLNVKMPAEFHAKLNPENISVQDRAVVAILQRAGYTDIDYIGGYATKGKRTERIGKILDRLLADLAKSPTPTFGEKYNLEMAKKRFIDAPHRRFSSTNAQNMWVLLSQNPHDIAQMSFTRNWDSCMNIDGGKYCRSPYAVIRSGGLVAYLINAPESTLAELVRNENAYIPSNIAVARVSIKTAINSNGEAIAVPEKRVYPMNIPGFWESVNDWLDKHQEGEAGRYRVYGGYSDMGKRTYVHVPRDHKGIYDYLSSNNYHRQDAALDYIFNSNADFPPVIWSKAISVLLRNSQTEYASDNYVNKLAYLMKKMPNALSKEDLEKLPYAVKGKLNLHNELERDLNLAMEISPDNKPLERYNFEQVNRTLDKLKETGFTDGMALNKLETFIGQGRYGYGEKSDPKIIVPQQVAITDKVMDILGSKPWNQLFGKLDWSSGRIVAHFVETAIERFLNDRTLEDVKKIIVNNEKNYYANISAITFKLRIKYITTKDSDPVMAEKINNAYKEVVGKPIID